MSTLRQIEANRRNAQKSTGPTTAEGKAISSLNALKSGIDAWSNIIPGEDPAELEALTTQFLLHFRPADPIQLSLVDTLISAEWIQRRLRRIEAQLWNYQIECLDKNLSHADFIDASIQHNSPLGHTYQDALDPFSRIHRRIDATNRMYLRTLKALQDLQAAAFATPVSEPPSPMPTQPLRNPGQSSPTVLSSMRRKSGMFDLSLEVLRVVEDAAIASARTMGMGDPHTADQAAVESMRRCLDTIAIDGTIVIGEGERDKAPMLYIGEKLGAAKEQAGALTVDIAVDPLEGTNLCSTGAGGAITVLAAAERGGLLHAPDCYMEKIIVGPAAKGAVDLDAPVKHNLKAIARRLQRGVDDLVVVVLDRPRHQQLIADIREAGARIRLISDGDLSAGIAAAVAGTGVHAVMGSGGAPEGVLTAAALRCLNGEILGRLVVKDEQQRERMRAMGIQDDKKIYATQELAPGHQIVFAASGVTDGNLLKGVRFFGDGTRTQSIVMTLTPARVRFVDTVHLENKPDVKVRFR
jgi:fructose-1,6-bisphosphatase class II